MTCTSHAAAPRRSARSFAWGMLFTLGVVGGALTAPAFAGTATLSWNANTEPDLAGYTVHYGASSGTYSSAVPVGMVTTYTVTGLDPGTYYFAITAQDMAGNQSGASTEGSKTVTDTTPPTIAAVTATGITASGATLTWTTDEAATSTAEYGTTTGYGSSTAIDSTLVTAHSRTVNGLTSSTMYHFRVLSLDATGNVAMSADYTFTTTATPDTTPPTLTGISAGSITTTGASITWTTNEAATTQVEYGTTTSYGSSTTLNATLLTAHSATVSGLTASTLYHFRVRSSDAASNAAVSGDLTFTTSAAPDTTPPTLTGIGAGSLTSTGATVTWTTNEASSTQVEYGPTTAYGSSTTLNVTLVTAHSAALAGLQAATLYHFRVRSSDAAGNAAVSGDATFTTAAAPDTTPPVISGTTASTVSATSSVITWSTNEASTSVVDYGLTTAYSATSSDATRVTSHSMTLTGLTASTVYHYRVRSADAAGNSAASVDFAFTTSAAPDTTPPSVSSIAAGSVTGSGATVTWTTNEASSTRVEYGTTTSYGSFTTLNATLVTAHSAALTGLQAATLYHFRVRSSDAAGNAAVSGDATFTTAAAPDTTPPSVSSIAAGSVTGSGATVIWTTNEASSTQVEYGPTTAYGSSTTLNATLVTAHSAALAGLQAATLYHFRVRSSDAAGNAAVSGDATFTTAAAPDTTPPSILNLTTMDVTSTSTVVTWSTTEPATSQVEYGLTTAYGQRSVANATLLTAHREPLSGLTPGATYHLRVLSADTTGNLATSNDLTVVIPSTTDTTPPQDVRNFSANGAPAHVALTWTNPSDADFAGVQIRFRTDRYPSGPTDGMLLGDFTGNPDEQGATTHHGLVSNVTYYYSAASYDRSGNRQNTVYASAALVSDNNSSSDAPQTGGCGMIIPSGGDPPGPWQAADLLILAAVALYLTRRRLVPGDRLVPS